MSNTEPLVRLNVETRGDIDLMKSKTEEILNLIEDLGWNNNHLNPNSIDIGIFYWYYIDIIFGYIEYGE